MQTAVGEAAAQRSPAEEKPQVWKAIDTVLARLPRDQRDALVNRVGVLNIRVYSRSFSKHFRILDKHTSIK